ncbi:MAG TPA: hypothetical protein VI636_04615 [Candidatus Angelobacter sp.]
MCLLLQFGFSNPGWGDLRPDHVIPPTGCATCFPEFQYEHFAILGWWVIAAVITSPKSILHENFPSCSQPKPPVAKSSQYDWKKCERLLIGPPAGQCSQTHAMALNLLYEQGR